MVLYGTYRTFYRYPTEPCNFQPARSANNHENLANEQVNGGHARDLDSCITAAVPHVALEGYGTPPTQDTLRVIASYPA